jgi:hypothetical protein
MRGLAPPRQHKGDEVITQRPLGDAVDLITHLTSSQYRGSTRRLRQHVFLDLGELILPRMAAQQHPDARFCICRAQRIREQMNVATSPHPGCDTLAQVILDPPATEAAIRDRPIEAVEHHLRSNLVAYKWLKLILVSA